ncbi:MAG: VWA domain-containing protein [Bacteroidaceae bacterium]|nr:VWA domain-containing protein [Bacteroidaceae bacterium]
MFRFENPEYLYALVLVPLLAVLHYWTNYRRSRRLSAYGDPSLLRGLMRDVSRWRPELKMWLALAALACLIVAAARPQFGTKIDTSERNGIEAIIAMDVSNSMLAEDVRPSRLDKSKMLVSNMVDDMKDDHVGLVVYAGQAFTQLPITNDYVSAKMFLESISPSMISVQGTDIAAAIDLSMQSFTQKKDVSRAIFLITDGEDNEGGAVEAAQAAAKKGIHVYVLGVGSPDGAHIPISGTTQYMIDNQGEAVVSRLNEEMCRQIAQSGNGAYLYVDNSSSAQDALSKYVDKLAKSKLESNIYSEYDEQFQGFLLLALLFLLIDVLVLERENHFFARFHLFRRAAVLVMLAVLSASVQAQTARDYVRRGNRLFRDSVYDKAQVEYQKAYEKDSSSVAVLYNLGNALLHQGQPKEAMRLLEKASKAEHEPLRRSMIFHNMGVILQSQKQYTEAIQCYKESLRHNPQDNETRYNYVLCQRQLKNQQNDKNGGKDDKNGDQKDKDDKKKQDQQKQEQQKQDQQKQDQKKQEQQQQQPDPNQMSKENAEQMLKAALQNERNTQDKVKQRQQEAQPRRLQKQW